MSRLVSWLKTSRVGLVARRTSMSSRLRANSARGPPAPPGGRPVLDLVDRVPEPVGEREIAIDDVVAEGPQQVVGTLG